MQWSVVPQSLYGVVASLPPGCVPVTTALLPIPWLSTPSFSLCCPGVSHLLCDGVEQQQETRGGAAVGARFGERGRQTGRGVRVTVSRCGRKKPKHIRDVQLHSAYPSCIRIRLSPSASPSASPHEEKERDDPDREGERRLWQSLRSSCCILRAVGSRARREPQRPHQEKCRRVRQGKGVPPRAAGQILSVA
jgi:hypothetical protein